jgi:hypothetical protein
LKLFHAGTNAVITTTFTFPTFPHYPGFIVKQKLFGFGLLLSLASAAGMADNTDMFLAPQSAALRKCQNDSLAVQQNSHCGTGDSACLARLQNQMDIAVKTCIRAMEELKQPVLTAPVQ